MNEDTSIRTGISEPVFPTWAGPVYLIVGLVLGASYFVFDLFIVSMPGMALFKTLGIVFLAAYAAFSRAWLLTLALLFSAGGDYALAMQPQQQVAGIASFAMAHILYAVIFAVHILKHGLRRAGLVLVAALVFFAIAMWVWLSPGMGALRLPVTGYFAIIIAMACLAAFSHMPGRVIVGALLFVISDALIALGWFKGFSASWLGIDLHGGAIWATYFSAQALLATGIVRSKTPKNKLMDAS